MIHVLTGAKGGVGTTTVTCLLGVETAAATNRSTYIIDAAGGDTLAALGLPAEAPCDFTEVTPLTTWTQLPWVEANHTGLFVLHIDRRDLGLVLERNDQHRTFVDAGRLPAPFLPGMDYETILVTDNGYLALRAVIATGPKIDHVVLTQHEAWALRLEDVERTLRHTPYVVPFSPTIARAVDAGLLSIRRPSLIHSSIKELRTALDPANTVL